MPDCIARQGENGDDIFMSSALVNFLEIFGNDEDSILDVERRADHCFGRGRCMVWEGNPETFQFTYVSKSAETILGYPVSSWVSEAQFWAEIVVHPDDRRTAIAYCALATGMQKDHDFVYRAQKKDGSVIQLHDVVKVVTAGKRLPVLLRGIMFPVSDTALVEPVFEKVASRSEIAA
jgi:PAS domain-containing protein